MELRVGNLPAGKDRTHRPDHCQSNQFRSYDTHTFRVLTVWLILSYRDARSCGCRPDEPFNPYAILIRRARDLNPGMVMSSRIRSIRPPFTRRRSVAIVPLAASNTAKPARRNIFTTAFRSGSSSSTTNIVNSCDAPSGDTAPEIGSLAGTAVVSTAGSST